MLSLVFQGGSIMLLNGKPEELIKYSKGNFNPELFIKEVKNNWELTDLQFRMTCLISDLAINAQGVFSVSYNSFVEMFNKRFEIKVSLSSVRRFFGLLSKLGLISVNAAKRKNNQQSANIYIIEPFENEEEKNVEHAGKHPDEQAPERPYEQQNITINKTIKKTFNKPLNNFDNNIVNKRYDYKQELEEETNFKLVKEYMSKGLNKLICLKVIDEINQNRWINKSSIGNYGAYLRMCLEGALEKVEIKLGKREKKIDKVLRNLGNSVPFYNWLEEYSC